MLKEKILIIIALTIVLNIIISLLPNLFLDNVLKIGWPFAFYSKARINAECLEEASEITCPNVMKPRVEWRPKSLALDFLFSLLIVLAGQLALNYYLKKNRSGLVIK